METEFEKHVGDFADIGRKTKDGGVFFIHAKITSASPTHLFIETQGKAEALLLTEIARIQFNNQPRSLIP